MHLQASLKTTTIKKDTPPKKKKKITEVAQRFLNKTVSCNELILFPNLGSHTSCTRTVYSECINRFYTQEVSPWPELPTSKLPLKYPDVKVFKTMCFTLHNKMCKMLFRYLCCITGSGTTNKIKLVKREYGQGPLVHEYTSRGPNPDS